MNLLPSYREELISQIPAARLLIAMGYQYLSPDQSLGLRGSNLRNVLLTDILREWLINHNQIKIRGEMHPFSDSAINEAIRRISDVQLNEGLVRANERIYELLTLGISQPHTHDGDTRFYSMKYIDWEHPENNIFHVTEEFVVERERSHQTRRPDIVCFVNGIPFAVIECKRPDLQLADGGLPYEEAISQHLRNQKDGEIRQLYAYSQLLLALSTNHAAYATTATDKKFWSMWKEEDRETHEQWVQDLVNRPLPTELDSAFYDWRDSPSWTRRQ